MLTPLVEPSAYYALLQEVKAGAAAFQTNLYALPEALLLWLQSGSLGCLRRPGAALVLRQDRHFSHVYHLAANPQALALALGELVAIAQGACLVADVVGRQATLEGITQLYQAAGFRRYATLQRMVAPGPKPATMDWDRAVVHATPTDVPALFAFLDRRLDPLTKQIPTETELLAATLRGEVLVCKQGEAIQGLLIMAITGRSAQLRYWFVVPDGQGRGIGSRLIRAFFQACQDCDRLVLWVLTDNQSVISQYRHYGFAMDPLMDQILVKGNISGTI